MIWSVWLLFSVHFLHSFIVYDHLWCLVLHLLKLRLIWVIIAFKASTTAALWHTISSILWQNHGLERKRCLFVPIELILMNLTMLDISGVLVGSIAIDDWNLKRGRRGVTLVTKRLLLRRKRRGDHQGILLLLIGVAVEWSAKNLLLHGMVLLWLLSFCATVLSKSQKLFLFFNSLE